MSLRDVLHPLDEVLVAVPEISELLNQQRVLNLGWLGQAWCEDLLVTPAQPDGHRLRCQVVFQTPQDLLLADLGVVRLAVPTTAGIIESLLVIRTGTRAGARVDLPVRLTIRQPWLRRVDLRTREVVGDGIEFEARVGVVVDASGLRLECPAVSVPPVMLAGTGLIVVLNDVQVLLDEDALPDGLRALAGGGPSRLLASRAALHWLPEFAPALADVPGLSVPLTDLVVEQDGISCRIEYAWAVHRDARGRLSPRSGAYGSLLKGACRAALRRVVGTVQANVPQQLQAEGLVEIPWLPGPADITLAWAGNAEASRVDLTLRHPGVQVPVSGGQLAIADLDLAGSIEGE